ncbi:MAG: LuxR family transcriptional regulator [Bradyrhizobium sp.]|uniref:helix-turn-helix transcriptional regulator n=1 Tax=Bradyrhizobium sp. TaxID=376 RepID=UPI001224F1B5|nr:helix-turn-helix transcriptional regulator [Bradyrhizobium sp.]THD47119.1 MAG: LuxR family transcriptional regulator [Bradyrhizobium sp.]
MIDESTFAALINAIYDAAIDFSRWPDALRLISSVCASHSTVLTRQGASPAESWSLAPQCEPAYYESYCSYYHGVNPLWQRAASAPAGTIQTDSMIMPKSELVRTEFYNDFLAPQRLGSMLNAVTLVERGQQTVIATHRKDEFDPEHIQLFQLLSPHLRRAVQLNTRLAGLETRCEASAEALNRLEQGALLVDECVGVVFASQEAERLFAAGDGLRVTEGVLCANSAADTALLHALVAGCARHGAEAGTGGSLRLSRRPDRSPISLQVAPLRSEVPLFSMTGRPVAILFVTDPDRKTRSPIAWLQRRFGLTAAEAAFAGEIVAGAGIQAAADRLQISRSTGRTHLARIFEKTGTHRQAELVRLILQRNREAGGEP